MHLTTRLALPRFCPPVTVVRCLDSRAGELERGWAPDCFAAGSGPTFRAHYMGSGVTSAITPNLANAPGYGVTTS
jgi:hypothetical protein